MTPKIKKLFGEIKITAFLGHNGPLSYKLIYM
jgi:hypothetical protein